MTAYRAWLLYVLTVFAVMLGGINSANCLELKPFDAGTFDAVLQSGKPVVVEISAPWCPICKVQKPIVQSLLDAPKYRDYTAFDIDFDTQKPDVRKLAATVQSTLIVFRAGKEVGRLVGETQPEWIEDLLDKAIR